MRSPLAPIAVATFAAAVSAQNLVPDGHFDAGATAWTMTQFNDPLGTTGFGLARVTGNGPSNALFANFQTLTPVMSATYRGQPFAMPPVALPVSFNVMWEKQVTTPIPSVTVNRVELRIYDFVANTLVTTFTQNSPNQTGLFERATFNGTFTPTAATVYVAEVFLRHSNLANMPYTTWVDDVVIGAPISAVFGQGCVGSGGYTPVLDCVNVPQINSGNFAIELHDAAPLTVALFLMGFSNTSYNGLPLPFALGGGCNLLVSMTLQTPHVLMGSAPGSGTASQLLPIPNIAGLQQLHLFAQWGIVDPAAANPFGIVSTAGLGFTIQ